MIECFDLKSNNTSENCDENTKPESTSTCETSAECTTSSLPSAESTLLIPTTTKAITSQTTKTSKLEIGMDKTSIWKQSFNAIS